MTFGQKCKYKDMQGVKIKQVEFNIGMNGNPYKEEYEIKEILKRSGFTVFDTTPGFFGVGEWNGADEPTYVIAASTTMSDDAIHAEVEGLAKIFHQSAIAIYVDNKSGALIYHPHYDKLRLTFNKEYFIDAYEKNYNKNYK